MEGGLRAYGVLLQPRGVALVQEMLVQKKTPAEAVW
jgi:hypothetical protein